MNIAQRYGKPKEKHAHYKDDIRGGIYDQRDATNSQYLLLTVCAAVRLHIQFRAPDDGQ
jgi:hypothetical protein